MAIAKEQLLAVMPRLTSELADLYLPELNQAMTVWDINTPVRQAAFLAQVAHKSKELTIWRETATGRAYEGREDLGNIYPGDGPKYKKGGLFPLLGRDQYRRCGRAIKVNLENRPSLITQPIVGFFAAGWFWTKEKKLNSYADLGTKAAFLFISKKLAQPGLTCGLGLTQWNRAKKALGV